jgi:hypothetical protein
MEDPALLFLQHMWERHELVVSSARRPENLSSDFGEMKLGRPNPFQGRSPSVVTIELFINGKKFGCNIVKMEA